jgi:uncharacterized protein (UPF0548 family)
MISIGIPQEDRVAEIFGALATSEYSYPDVGATRGAIPRGFHVDRYAATLGRGEGVFESAKDAIRGWKQFDLPWIRVIPQSQPAPGVMVAVVARILGLWWTNVSRVIYTVEETDAFGFAYGTLPFHAETGEELFLVERSRESGEVTYRVLAFSRPRHPLARLGYPLSRAAQRRFGAGSIEAMKRATSSAAGSPDATRTALPRLRRHD